MYGAKTTSDILRGHHFTLHMTPRFNLHLTSAWEGDREERSRSLFRRAPNHSSVRASIFDLLGGLGDGGGARGMR